MLKNNANFYHTLHEQVALGLQEKEQEAAEKENGIDVLRQKLIAQHAQGIVLETCVGTNPNRKYYDDSKIRKLIGLDWVQANISKAQIMADKQGGMTILNCDIHQTPFSPESFDTVVDTFGLECCYNIE